MTEPTENRAEVSDLLPPSFALSGAAVAWDLQLTANFRDTYLLGGPRPRGTGLAVTSAADDDQYGSDLEAS
jgi:hypothetical protein